jgi:Na+-transporting NADH:ubiquinone oxidoreductase subunit NqrF
MQFTFDTFCNIRIIIRNREHFIKPQSDATSLASIASVGGISVCGNCGGISVCGNCVVVHMALGIGLDAYFKVLSTKVGFDFV